MPEFTSTSSLWIDGALVLGLLITLVVLVRASAMSDLRVPRPRPYFPKLAQQAGFEPKRLSRFYWIVKAVLAGLGLILGFSFLPRLWPGLLLALVGAFLPDLLLVLIRRSRQQRIRRSLSFFLDLLTALCRSGLAPDAAFGRAGRQGFETGHPLAREVARIDGEIASGRDRELALGSLVERTGVREWQPIAATLILGGRVGVPLADALAAQADLQRERRFEAGRRRIDRLAITALLPMFLCGYPLFVVLVVMPAGLELAETWNQLKNLLL